MALSIQETLLKHSENLMNRQHVTGVGIGQKRIRGKGEAIPCITVFVEKKVAPEQLAPEDMLPKKLEGFEVDVVESGEFKAH